MMNEQEKSAFADQLMKTEPASEELRRRYDEQRLALVERRLSPAQRWLGWISIALIAALVAALAYKLALNPAGETREWLLLEGVAAAGLLLLGGWIVRVLLRGNRVSWQDDRAMEWISGISLAAIALALFEVGQSLEDAHLALRLHGCITVLAVGGVFGILVERMRRLKLEMRVQLLELELKTGLRAESMVGRESAAG